MKNKIIKIFKAVGVGIVAVILVTVGIDATDHYDNMSESIVGRIFFGASEGACPSDMIFVQAGEGDFCIDRYEVSASDGCQYPVPRGTVESRDNLDKPKCEPVSVANATPWTNISQNQAVRACSKMGKRLPTNKEWSMAALGTPDPSSGWSQDDCQVDNNWDNQPGKTGIGSNCVSYAGAFDMVGNVWEWVDGTVVDGTYKGRALPEAGFVFGINEEDALPSDTNTTAPDEYYDDYLWIKGSGTRVISRGGYWGNKNEAGQYAHYIVDSPTSAGSGIGFRCVMKAGL